jgi:hypothetical protein
MDERMSGGVDFLLLQDWSEFEIVMERWLEGKRSAGGSTR